MIILENVSKLIGKREVLAPTSVTIPSNRRIAILSRVPGDARIFLEIIAGVAMPTAGHIVRKAHVSFPVGHSGGFARELSVRLNVAHVARLYGADVPAVVDFVDQVMDLGLAFDKPFSELGSAARIELGAILTYSIPFDTYVLLDDIAFPGTRRFNKKIFSLFEARARTSGMLVASRDRAFARDFCDIILVLNRGKLQVFEDVKSATPLTEQEDP